jgi:nicotinamide riboside kinase
VNEMKKWQTIISVILVFLLGSLAGALVTHRIYQHRVESIIKGEPKPITELIVQRLNHDLHLDSTQLEQLRTIVKETRAEMKNVRKQFRPKIEEILARSQNKVRAILHPDQLEKYEKIVAERKKKHEDEDNSK